MNVRKYAEWMESHLALAGNLPRVEMPAHENCQQQDFVHAPDYSTVIIKGQQFVLTPQERQVIQLLHEAYLSSKPDLGIHYMIQEVKGSDSSHRKLRDIFRNADARKALIRQGQRKDTVRLNLD